MSDISPEPAAARPVTIVVPVYGDLPSLSACVDSLLAHVDQRVHRVLLVNDCGPEADVIETALLARIEGQRGFEYARNPRNLGFVGNCNRAALELDTTTNDLLFLNSDTVVTAGFVDELSTVLHLSPSHGAVCARSNNATIASLPFKLRDPSVGRGMARTAEVHAQLAAILPRFGVAPVAMGFCILIRRELISTYGLFDEIFAPGYGEENDFCLRIGQHGYRSVIAHRALVFHQGARSFVGARREALRSSHEKIVVSRYPHYTDAVQRYIHQERDPVDAFADAMVPGDDVVRVLIDIEVEPGARLSPAHRELLSAASAVVGSGVTIAVSVPDSIASGTGKRYPRLRIFRHSRLDGLWDLALIVGDRPDGDQLGRLNRTSLRWVQVVGAESRHDIGFANAVLNQAEIAVDAPLLEVLNRCGRSVVDVDALRRRWLALTAEPYFLSGASVPRERPQVRLLRRAEYLAPRAVGLAKGLTKRMLGSN